MNKMGKKHCRTVFISDIHLGNLKNQGNKLVEFLDSLSFENLIIIGDFIDYRQLRWFGKRGEREQNTLDYINSLSKSGVNITYIQGNHDRALKCGNKIHVENMTVIRDMYYKTSKGKTYYITHGDCLDGINKEGNKLGQSGSIIFGGLLRIEQLWNKNVLNHPYLSIAERFEEWIKKHRMPENRIRKMVSKFSKNLSCDGMILGHFHVVKHYEVNGLDYFNTGDWLRNCSAVIEDSKGNLELIVYK